MDQRTHFHADLDDLEQQIHNIGDRCNGLILQAVTALVSSDMASAHAVVAQEASIEERYLAFHDRWFHLIATQQPMGADLRLMSVLLHMSVTLKRTGDQAVNIAKLAELTHHLPGSKRMGDQIQEMGDLVRPMLRSAIEAFIRRDIDLAMRLADMDEPVDRLNKGMYREVVALGADPQLLEWATHMMMAARALERIGDQAVDIGEQVGFLVTGEFHDFDAAALLDHR